MKTIVTLITLNLLFISSIYATGPSYIFSEMRPVAINNNGDVLCYTRFERNEMGARMPMPRVYGYCILTQDTIIHYTMKVLEWDDNNFEAYETDFNLWESIYKGSFKEKYLTDFVREKYKFKTSGVGEYKINKTTSISEFNKSKSIDINKIRQKALFGGLSENNYSQQNNKVHVLYDFGSIVVFQNNILEDEENYGSVFNYVNYMFPDIGYEENRVTGVLFIEE